MPPILVNLIVVVVGVAIVALATVFIPDPTLKAMIAGVGGTVIGWVIPRPAAFSKSDDDDQDPPALRSGGVAFLLMIVGALVLMTQTACQQVKDVVFPVVAKCSPVPREILDETFRILKNDPGGTLTDRGLNLLEQLAKKYGPNAIACAVSHFASLLSAPGDLEGNRVQSKAIDFQERLRVRADFEEPAAAPAPCMPAPAAPAAPVQ